MREEVKTDSPLFVSSRDMFESMNKTIETNGIKTVIGKTFEFQDADSAFEYLKGGLHFGMVVIS